MDFKKISDFLEGKCEPKDVDEIIKWIHGEGAKSEVESRLKSDKFEFDCNESEDLFEKITSKIKEYEGVSIMEPTHSEGRHRPKRIRSFIIGLAASVSLFIIGYSAFFSELNDQTGTDVFQFNTVLKIAELGQKLTIQLNDGSIVKLNAGSQLEYNPDTFLKDRKVSIKGEAFFEIAKDSTRPFRVNADDLFTVRVLGTKFNVNTYDYKQIKTVTLTEGQVSVDNSAFSQPMLLEPGEQLVFDTRYNSFQKEKVDLDLHTGWKDGRLLFNREPLKMVFNKLAYWYGVEFEFAGSLLEGACELDAEFNNQSLALVLASIASVYDFQYEMENNSVKIRGDTCQ